MRRREKSDDDDDGSKSFIPVENGVAGRPVAEGCGSAQRTRSTQLWCMELEASQGEHKETEAGGRGGEARPGEAGVLTRGLIVGRGCPSCR